MYTVTEVAKMFSVSRQTVLKWINNGKIKAVKNVYGDRVLTVDACNKCALLNGHPTEKGGER